MDWDSVLEGTGRPGWLGMLMLLLCQKRSTSSLILTSQVRKSNFPRRRGGRLLFCLFGGPCFFCGKSLRVWKDEEENQVNHQGYMTFFCQSWPIGAYPGYRGWGGSLFSLWKGIWTYSEDLPIDFISKASKQLANPPISPPFHVAADLSLAPRWGKGFRHTFGWNTSFPTFLAPGLSSVSFNRNQGEKPKGRLKGKAKVQAMMLIIANTLVFESPFFLGTLYLNHHHMLANVSLFFVEGENSWYIHSVSSPTSIWGNLQRDTFI